MPTLSCENSGDIYTLKAGLITADEVSMAGGKMRTENSSYYLYSGSSYWTMSPSSWDYNSSSDMYIGVLMVWWTGDIDYEESSYNSSNGVRPVINLKADTQFQAGGLGTYASPYVVV